MYPNKLLDRKESSFILWIPGSNEATDYPPPKLVIGTLKAESKSFNELTRQALTNASRTVDLWELDPKSIEPSLSDGVYHYWFEIQDTSPEQLGSMLVTDPMAFTVDYRISQGEGEQLQPASVIKYQSGNLLPCDIDGGEAKRPAAPDQKSLPSNNHMVIYELPTSWATVGNDERGVHVDVGTFADVKSLFDDSKSGKFKYGGILADLGVNALELLPVQDAKSKAEWGYATANYFAPDTDLGSASDLVALVETLHGKDIRFIMDQVMAFGHDPYGYIAFKQMHLRPKDEPDNQESYQSHAPGVLRDGFGGQSWRYCQSMKTYDPETDQTGDAVFPAWQFHRAHLARWMTDFMVGGLRLDSVNNVGSWDFLRAYKERAWEMYTARYGADSAEPSKFLVIAEELSMPLSMIHSGVVNALWNQPWQRRVRAVLLGEATEGDEFEWTVRKLADCRLDRLDGSSFSDGAQAVNYITSHDIEGDRQQRLYDFLQESKVWDVERRAKLAFALLLTSVGIPMIFAGEEFADQMDSSVDMAKKQIDPVNYSRKDDGGWRQSLFGYVANLVKFRTKCPALGEDDTDFFHVDQGGKIMAWRRGQVGEGKEPVVVVVNFTDHDTAGEQYVISNWPDADKDGWREVSQNRDVPIEWVGKEPLMTWEAKVFTRWRE